MEKVTIYHGGYAAVAQPQIIIEKNTKDFGPGFYCTIIRAQALKCLTFAAAAEVTR